MIESVPTVSKLAARLAVVVTTLALALAVSVHPAFAATDLYVAPTGNDANDCLTPATACATVTAALSKAADGDTIYVAAGSYSEQVVIDRSVTLLGPNAGVDPNTATRAAEANFSGAGPVFTLQDGTSGVNGVTIDGFAFENVTGSGYNGVITVPGYGAGNVTIRNNTFSDVTEEAIGYHGNTGLAAPLGSGWTVANNRVERVTGANRSGMFFGNLSDSVISDNVVIDPARSGILIVGGTNITLSGNIVDGAVFGLNIGTDATSNPIANVVVEGNTLTGSDVGIVVNSPTSTPDVTIRSNRLTGNTTGLFSNATSPIDATNQWWGCNAGPGASGCDSVTDLVDADPWLVLSLTADPAAVQTGGTSSLRADLTVNSDGATVGSSLTDGTLVDFSVDAGSLSATSAGTVAGVASVTFTAGSSAGSVSTVASLDNATASAGITVTAAPSPSPSASLSPSASPSPSPTPTLSPSPSASSAAEPTPTPSAVATLPDTSVGGGDSSSVAVGVLALLAAGAFLLERRRYARRGQGRWHVGPPRT